VSLENGFEGFAAHGGPAEVNSDVNIDDGEKTIVAVTNTTTD
jgi:hypothetical protein